MALSVEQFRERLREKIDSKEKFDALLIEASELNRGCIGKAPIKDENGRITAHGTNYSIQPGYVRPAHRSHLHLQLPRFFTVNDFGEIVFGDYLHYSRWWLAREWLRVHYNVYDLTAPLAQLNARFTGLVAHIATAGEDPTMIAYTPDPHAGEQDRQLRTTLAKLVRKLYPELSDDQIRDFEARHRAELCTEIEFLTDADKIVEAYLTGPDSCMKKPVAHWPKQIHPVSAYAMPGIALAVQRDLKGRVNARCVTYVNPQDPKDKRYVRVYGDLALQRALERNGFRSAGLAGAKLARIQIAENSRYTEFAVPYLDPPGGPNGCGDSKATYAIVQKDGLLLVDNDMAAKLKQLGFPTVSCQTASGQVVVRREDVARMEEGLERTCMITGKRDSLFTPGWIMVYRDGEIGWALSEAPGLSKESVLVYDKDGSAMRVRVVGEYKTFKPHCSSSDDWLDTPSIRERFGYVQLSEKFYPNVQTRWVHPEVDKLFLINRDGPKHYIYKTDAVHVIRKGDSNPIIEVQHLSEFEPHRKNFRRITRYDNHFPCYCEKTVEVVRTVSGRKVVPGVHPVVQLITGEWDFERRCTKVSLMWGTKVVWVPQHARDSELPTLTIDDEWRKKILQKIDELARFAGETDVTEIQRRTRRLLNALYGLSWQSLSTDAGGALYVSSVDTYGSMHTFQGAVNAARTALKDPNAAKGCGRFSRVLSWTDWAWGVVEFNNAFQRVMQHDKEAQDERFVLAA